MRVHRSSRGPIVKRLRPAIALPSESLHQGHGHLPARDSLPTNAAAVAFRTCPIAIVAIDSYSPRFRHDRRAPHSDAATATATAVAPVAAAQTFTPEALSAFSKPPPITSMFWIASQSHAASINSRAWQHVAQRVLSSVCQGVPWLCQGKRCSWMGAVCE